LVVHVELCEFFIVGRVESGDGEDTQHQLQVIPVPVDECRMIALQRLREGSLASEGKEGVCGYEPNQVRLLCQRVEYLFSEQDGGLR
jgi:hypothetical protein